MARPDGNESRLPLAAAVAVACVLAGIGLVSLLGGSGDTADPARAQAAVAPEPASTTGHAHRRNLDVPGMNERELREMETITLGPEHAREHALMRRAIRRRDALAAESEGSVRRATATAPTAAAAAAGDPADIGQWETAKAIFPIAAIHAALLPTGKVLIFSYPPNIVNPPDRNYSEAWLWDPASGSLVQKDPPDFNGKPANIWCAGQTFTADGELLVFGGNLEYDTVDQLWKGLNKVYTFNPFTETWTEQPDMRHGRWYPTGIRLPDGRIPIINGLDESGSKPASIDPDVELFTPPATPGGVGTLKLIGSLGGAGNPPIGDLYPRMFAMPSGRTVLAGPDPYSTWAFDSISDTGFTWSDFGDLSRFRIWGTSVLLPSGASGSTKILALGGTDYSGAASTNTSEIFDDANPSAGWHAAPSTHIGRGHANTVSLPDGSMVEVGGGVGSDDTFPSPLHKANPEQRQIELWNPTTGEWRLGPAQTESRAYHSTALLLPDATVLSAGDEYNGDGDSVDTGEIYKPPYLFRGSRPTIASAPASVDSCAGFGVDTPDTNIARAALVAPGAVTHGVDMNQRVIQLDVTQGVGSVNLTAPAVNVAPPGWYMLFLLNDQGVPSVAKFVKLQAGAAASTCTVLVGQNAPAAGGTLVSPENLAPTISRLKISRASFRKGTQTKISFRLSEPATVKLSFERRLAGHRSRGRCVSPPKKSRAKCSLYARVKTAITLRGKAGSNSLLFRGKLSRTRSLAPGRYRLTAVATDSTGTRSAAAHASFRLLESAARSRARAMRTAVLSWF